MPLCLLTFTARESWCHFLLMKLREAGRRADNAQNLGLPVQNDLWIFLDIIGLKNIYSKFFCYT